MKRCLTGPSEMASEDAVVAFNVQVEADGLQGRSKLEKAMQEWFEGRGQRSRFVLWRAWRHGQVDAGAQVRGSAGRGRCLFVGALGVCAVRGQHGAGLCRAPR